MNTRKSFVARLILLAVLLMSFSFGCSGGGGGSNTASGPTISPTPSPTGTGDFVKIEETSGSGVDIFHRSYYPQHDASKALEDMLSYLQSRTDTVKVADLLSNQLGAKTEYFNQVREAFIAPGKQFLSPGMPTIAQKEKCAKLIQRAMASKKALTKPGIPLKKALILSPFNWQFQDWATEKLETVKACLEGIGFTVTYKYNYSSASQYVTVEDFKKLSDYGLIYINTHGMTMDGKVVLNTGQLCTSDVYLQYIADFTAGRLVRVKFFENDTNTYVGVTPEFIRAYCGSFPGSLILVSAENSAAGATSTMASAFLDKGVYAYMGWDKEVYSETTYFAETELFSQMISCQKTNGEALDYVATQGLVPDKQTGATFKILPSNHNDLSLFDAPVN